MGTGSREGTGGVDGEGGSQEGASREKVGGGGTAITTTGHSCLWGGSRGGVGSEEGWVQRKGVPRWEKSQRGRRQGKDDGGSRRGDRGGVGPEEGSRERIGSGVGGSRELVQRGGGSRGGVGPEEGWVLKRGGS